MKKLLLFIFSCLSAGITCAQAHWLWAKDGDVGTNQGSESWSVAVDNSGNSYMAGYYEGATLTFGNLVLNSASPLYTDIFLSKYDAAGNLLWARSWGGSD